MRGLSSLTALNPRRLIQRLIGGFLMGFGFFGEVGGDEEFGDFLFFRGVGPEVGDALFLFLGERGFLRRGRAWLPKNQVVRADWQWRSILSVAAVLNRHAPSTWIEK